MPVLTLIIAAVIGGGGTYWIFCRLEGRQPVRELMYELWLTRRCLRELDADAALRSRSDVIVGLTTIPSRLPHLVPTLKSLLAQDVLPAKIVLHIPRKSRREERPYRIPHEIAGLNLVEVVRCQEWGPATKILPLLLSSEPDQRVIAVDDDRIYRSTFVEDLTRASEDHDDAAVGCCGLLVPTDRVDRRRSIVGRTWDGFRFGRGVSLRGSRLKRAMPVDILQGYGGLLVRPRFFDLAALSDFDSAPAAAWMEDDTWFAAHCHSTKLLVPIRPGSFPRLIGAGPFRRSRLGLYNRGRLDPEHRNTTTLMRIHAARWLD